MQFFVFFVAVTFVPCGGIEVDSLKDQHPMLHFLTDIGRSLAWHPSQPPLGVADKFSSGLSSLECREGGFFSPTNFFHSPKWPICLRTQNEVVTAYISEHGSWPDCAILPALYFDVPGRHARFLGQHGMVNPGRSFFFDVGSNIGSCSLEMLVRLPEVRVIAFEPSPQNQFYLTRSMVQLAKAMPSVLERFILLPVAVGNSSAAGETLLLKDGAGNQGGTELAVEGVIPGGPRLTAQIWAIDKLVNGEKLHRGGSLMKMDVQGCECHAIDGMREVLKGVGVLKSELCPLLLEKQGCGKRLNDANSLALLHQIRIAGFNVSNEEGSPANTPAEIQSSLFSKKKYRMHSNIDFIARKTHHERSV